MAQGPYDGLPTLDDALSLGAQAYNDAAARYQQLAQLGASREMIQRQAKAIGFAPVALDPNGKLVDLTDFYARKAEMSVGEQIQDVAAGFGRGIANLPADLASIASIPVQAATGYTGVGDFATRYRQGVNEMIPTSNQYRDSTAEAVGQGISSVATMFAGGAGLAKAGIGVTAKVAGATEAARRAAFATAAAKNAMRIATIQGAGGEAGAAQAAGAGVGAQLLAAGGGAAAAQLERFGAERILSKLLSPAGGAGRYTRLRAAGDVAGGFAGEVGEELVAAPITVAGRSGYEKDPYGERLSKELGQTIKVAPLAILPFSALHGFKAADMVRRDTQLAQALPDIYSKRTGSLKKLAKIEEGKALERNILTREQLLESNPDAVEEIDMLSSRTGAPVVASSAATERVSALGQMLSQSGLRVVYFEPQAKEGEGPSDVSGYYDPRTATVYVNSALSENAQIMQGLTHEVMHDLHKDSPGGLMQIHDRLEKAFGKTYTDYMDRVAGQYKEYEAGSQELAEEQVNNFLTQAMAGYMGMAFTNQDVFKYAAYNDPGLLSSVAETFSRFMGLSIDKYNERDQAILSQRLENIANELSSQFMGDPNVGKINPTVAIRVANEVVLGMQNALELRAALMPKIRAAVARGPERGQGVMRMGEELVDTPDGGMETRQVPKISKNKARSLAAGALTESEYDSLYPEGTYPVLKNDVVVTDDSATEAVGTVIAKAGEQITPEVRQRIMSVPRSSRTAVEYSESDILQKLVERAIRVEQIPQRFMKDYAALSAALREMEAAGPKPAIPGIERVKGKPTVDKGAQEAAEMAELERQAKTEAELAEVERRRAESKAKEQARKDELELQDMILEEEIQQEEENRRKSEEERRKEFEALAAIQEMQRKNNMDEAGSKASMYLLARKHISRMKAELRQLNEQARAEGRGNNERNARQDQLELAIGEYYKLERQVKELFGRGFDIDTEAPPSVARTYRKRDYTLERQLPAKEGETELGTELRSRERQEYNRMSAEMKDLNDRREAILKFLGRARGRGALENTLEAFPDLSSMARRAMQAKDKVSSLRKSGDKKGLQAAQGRLESILGELEETAIKYRRRYGQLSKERAVSRGRSGLYTPPPRRKGPEDEGGQPAEPEGPTEPEGGPPGQQPTPPEGPAEGGVQPEQGQPAEDQGEQAQTAEERIESAAAQQPQEEQAQTAEDRMEAAQAVTQTEQKVEQVTPPAKDFQGVKIPPPRFKLPKRRTNTITNALDAGEVGVFVESMPAESFSMITKENMSKPMEWKSPEGSVPVAFIGGRFVAILSIGGQRVPYYNSTGEGGKAANGVVPGRWYPFFGFGSDGWLNKGLGSDMANYYGSDRLAMGAELLDSLYPNMALEGSPFEQGIPVEKLRKGRDVVNGFISEVDPASPSRTPNRTFSLKEAQTDPNAFGQNLRSVIARSDSDWAITRDISPDGTVAAREAQKPAETTQPKPEPKPEPKEEGNVGEDGKYRDANGNWQPGHPNRLIKTGVPDDYTAERAVQEYVKAEADIKDVYASFVDARSRGKLSGRYQTRLENSIKDLETLKAKVDNFHWALTGKHLNSGSMAESVASMVDAEVQQREEARQRQAESQRAARQQRERKTRQPKPAAEQPAVSAPVDTREKFIDAVESAMNVTRTVAAFKVAELELIFSKYISAFRSGVKASMENANGSLKEYSPEEAKIVGASNDLQFFNRLTASLANDYLEATGRKLSIDKHLNYESATKDAIDAAQQAVTGTKPTRATKEKPGKVKPKPAAAQAKPAEQEPSGTQRSYVRLVESGAKISRDAIYDASVLRIKSEAAKPDKAFKFIGETWKDAFIQVAEEDGAFLNRMAFFYGTDKDIKEFNEYLSGLKSKAKEKYPDGSQTPAAKTASNKLEKYYPAGALSKPNISRVVPSIKSLTDQTKVVASASIDNPRLSATGFKRIKDSEVNHRYLLLSDSGVTSSIDAKLYNNISSRYPEAKVYLNGTTSNDNIAFVYEGRVVGMIMPLVLDENARVAVRASEITILPDIRDAKGLQPSRLMSPKEQLASAEPNYERSTSGVTGFLEQAYTAAVDRFEAIRSIERNIARAADAQAQAAVDDDPDAPPVERAVYNSTTMNVSEMLDLYTGIIGENNKRAMEQRDEMVAAAKQYNIPLSMQEGRDKGVVSADEMLYASHAEVANTTLLEDRVIARFDASDEGVAIKKKIRSLNSKIRKESKSDDPDEDQMGEWENQIGELEGQRQDTIDEMVRDAFALPFKLRAQMDELKNIKPINKEQAAEINTKLNDLSIRLEKAEDEAKLSGMTNEEAREINKRVQASPARDGYKRIREAMTKLQNLKVEIMVAAELVDPSTAATWRKRFGPTYIPLKSTIRDPDGSSFSGGGGLSIRGKETKARRGRSDYADDIIAHALVDFSQANSRATRNRVQQAMFELIKANRNSQNWTHLGTDLGLAKKAGLYNVRDKERLIAVKRSVPRKGGMGTKTVEEYAIVHSEDLARAVRQLDGIDLGNFTAGAVYATRFFTRMQTAWNPAFILPNFVRDMALATGVRYADSGVRAAARLLKNIPGAIRTILAVELGQDKIGRLFGAGKLSPGPFADEYEQMKRLGGFSSPVDYGTVEEQMRRFQKEARAESQSKVGRAVRVSTGAVKTFFEFIEAINTVTERATRLAAFIEMDATMAEANPRHLAGSMKEKRAAAAKNMTVNFDRRGTAGPIINSLYAFYNANVQGTSNLVRRLGPNSSKETRIRSGIAVSAFAIAGYALSALARAMADDDEEGESAYKAVGLDEMQKSAVVMIPGGGSSRITFPLPWGANMAWFMGVQIERIAAGDVEATKAADEVVGGLLTSFSPITGPTASMALVPTLARPFAEIDANINYAGNAIMPPLDPYDKTPLPDSRRSFRTVGSGYRLAAEAMNDITGGSARKPGFVDISPESLEHIGEFMAGGVGRFVANSFGADLVKEEVKLRDVPVVGPIAGRFVRQSDAEQRTISEFYSNVAKVAMYKEDLNDPETREEALKAGLGAMPKYATTVESKIRKLRELELSANARQDKETAARLKESRLAMMRTFNQRYNKVANN